MKRIAVVLAILLFLIVACQVGVERLDDADVTAVTPQPTLVDEVIIVERTAAPGEEVLAVTPMDLFLRPTVVTETVIVSDEAPQPTLTPTPTPPPPKTLQICQVAEPDSLFLYSTPMLDKQNLFHAIYENLYTTLDYAVQPQGLVKLPSLADGDAMVTAVTVQTGDQVVNSDGEVITLIEGAAVRNSAGDIVIFDGTPIEMNQMEVNFELLPMVWSDGTAVTADDSVFSFELNRDYEHPNQRVVGREELVERTAVYEGTGDLTLRWVGLPGYRDNSYFTNVWTPLPRHHIGDYPLEQLATLPDSARLPLSSGPFVVTEWTPGQIIVLEQNPFYYRQDEGFPKVDRLEFRFAPESDQMVSQIMSGRCDVGVSSGLHLGLVPILQEAANAGTLNVYPFDNPIMEHISFGITPSDEFEGVEVLQDAQVRQAIALCTNRQRMIDEALFGVGQIAHSYLPNRHPLTPKDMTIWVHDPVTGNALLTTLGLVDTDGDGIRELSNGEPLRMTFNTTLGAELRPAIGALFAEDMADCGIEIEEEYVSGETMFQEGREGLLFGRRFDTALFAWVVSGEPICDFWHSENIPSEANDWQGNNVAGWQNAEFDAACDRAQGAFPGSAAYVEGHQTAVRIFTEELPTLPLFSRVLIAITRPDVQNFQPNPSQPSQLWNIYELDIK